MSIPRLQTVISANYLSMVDSGDPLAVMQAMEAAVSNELCGAAVTYSETAKKQMVELDQLNQSPIQDELTNLTQFLSPNGLRIMAKADNDTSVAMDPTTNTALQAELASLGFSLKADARCFVIISTYDPAGNLLSESPSHLATAAEMAELNSGVKQQFSTGFGDYEVSTVTAANGSTTTYGSAPFTMSAVASIADINNLKTAIEARRQSLYSAINAETLKVQAFSNNILERMKEGQSLFDGRREAEFKSAEKTQDIRRQDIDRQLTRKALDTVRLKESDLKPTGGSNTPPTPFTLADSQTPQPKKDLQP